MRIEEIDYQSNSADLFSHFVHLPHAIFLDSCKPQMKQGRYDVITAAPEKIINANQFIKADDLFQAVDKALKRLKKNIQHKSEIDLPFTLGAIGYLSYGIGTQLAKVPKLTRNDISLPSAIIGIYHWSIVVDHKKQKTYLVTKNDCARFNRENVLNLLKAKSTPNSTFYLTKPFQSNMTKAFYAEQFDVIKKHIFEGNCYQINFAQRFSASFGGSPWHAYQILRHKHPAPFSAFIKMPKGAILSLSPERFLKVSEKRVETKPIKGTMPRFSDPAKDQASASTLINSTKDRAENLMIVDLLRNDLSQVCVPGSVKVPHLFALESFSNVHHLVSTVVGELRPEHSPLSLLKKCFPGGSITGAPKISAMNIIESLEPHQRSIYCGSIFYSDVFDRADSNIAIRTIIADQSNLHCYGGGGIVYDSNCEKEYDETWAKVGKLIQILSDIKDT